MLDFKMLGCNVMSCLPGRAPFHSAMSSVLGSAAALLGCCSDLFWGPLLVSMSACPCGPSANVQYDFTEDIHICHGHEHAVCIESADVCTHINNNLCHITCMPCCYIWTTRCCAMPVCVPFLEHAHTCASAFISTTDSTCPPMPLPYQDASPHRYRVEEYVKTTLVTRDPSTALNLDDLLKCMRAYGVDVTVVTRLQLDAVDLRVARALPAPLPRLPTPPNPKVTGFVAALAKSQKQRSSSSPSSSSSGPVIVISARSAGMPVLPRAKAKAAVAAPLAASARETVLQSEVRQLKLALNRRTVANKYWKDMAQSVRIKKKALKHELKAERERHTFVKRPGMERRRHMMTLQVCIGWASSEILDIADSEAWPTWLKQK